MLRIRIDAVLDIGHARDKAAGALVIQRVEAFGLLVFDSGFAHQASFIRSQSPVGRCVCKSFVN